MTGKKITDKTSKNKDVVFLPLIFVSVVIIGILGFLLMQKLADKNRLICTYIGRLWMPDKEKNIPGLSRCYTYEEYYSE